MSPDLPSQLPASFKNRRGWLIALGVFEILIACVCLLFAALTLMGLLLLSHANRPAGGPQLSTAGAVLASLFYGGLAALFLVLGVGSIKCKNWARIGSQIVSGFWLFTGILTGFVVFFVVPAVIEQQGIVPPEQRRLVITGTVLAVTVLMVLPPAILLVFYSLKSVRATCLGTTVMRTAAIGSDGRAVGQPPVPVILLALYECLGAMALFSLLIVKANVVFGIVVRGPAAILLMTAHAVLSVIAACLVYRRDYLGWAISLFKTLFWAASWVFTLLSRDLIDLYREMGLADQQMLIFRQLPHFHAVVLVSTTAGFAVSGALIFYTKKFFSKSAETT